MKSAFMKTKHSHICDFATANLPQPLEAMAVQASTTSNTTFEILLVLAVGISRQLITESLYRASAVLLQVAFAAVLVRAIRSLERLRSENRYVDSTDEVQYLDLEFGLLWPTTPEFKTPPL